jgi:hypothetical protein
MTMAGYFSFRYLGPDRTVFLPGQTSHGHYQIELACNACHTPWLGVKEDACSACHAAELKAANDTHPKSKFTDPRNADRLKAIRADLCVTCHREHVPEITRALGVTLPMDYCAHCHQQTLEDRASHSTFPFDSCATAGCHNYHDNTALYTDFLLAHADEPKVRKTPRVPERDLVGVPVAGRANPKPEPLEGLAPNAPISVAFDDTLLRDWLETAHAQAGVNCADCHVLEVATTKERRWSDQLDHTACAGCHPDESRGFLAGHHGMRLAQGLGPMLPAMARLPMKPEAARRALECTACHGAHRFDTGFAAVDACLECHNDGHSLAYKQSSHFELWQDELARRSEPGAGVSCATCHLPRIEESRHGNPRVLVQHNQNDNLRPNEKMIRSVCLHCHGLGFSLDALADAELVLTNFIGQPSRQVESIAMALRWRVETETRKSKGLKP